MSIMPCKLFISDHCVLAVQYPLCPNINVFVRLKLIMLLFSNFNIYYVKFVKIHESNIILFKNSFTILCDFCYKNKQSNKLSNFYKIMTLVQNMKHIE